MKTFSATIAILLASAAVTVGSQAGDAAKGLSGPYLGQTPPGMTPEVFAPGIISTPGWEYGVVFSPSMKELYWVREVNADTEPEQQFVVYEQKADKWHERVIGDRTGTATLSRDGQTMFFGRSYKERTADGWSDFKRLGPAFEDIRIMRVTESAAGTIFFDEAIENSTLRYSRLVNGEREDPKPLPKEINTGKFNAHPFIAPDESYIIWDGQRNSDVRNADLFISFKNADGSWSEAIKFDDRINTPKADFAAHVTPDGKYLFFNRSIDPDNTDTYWVDAKIIEEMRPRQ
ncbi:MAG: PD40 domain-containing protein [Alphaproteobacteria bacterium]|nr:PD40 domain-containing protein [Alphaproteobacteria bacterium]